METYDMTRSRDTKDEGSLSFITSSSRRLLGLAEAMTFPFRRFE